MRLRILGGSGSGKSTLARQLGRRYNLPVLHLDDIYWLEGWKEKPWKKVHDEVQQFLHQHQNWIIEGNYSKIQELTFEQATHTIFCYPPLYKNVWRLFWRELVRRSPYKFLPISRPPLNTVQDKNDMMFFPGTWLLMEHAIKYYRDRAQLWIDDLQEKYPELKIYLYQT